MPLDEFKTQVLLLHSEQTTLDNLSSGFGDRYTVHCATSGSEALNTLVETPINVIITAQDLPGMSGLEALREAKKRSPDTIGILLAGNKTSDIEALVGDEEVFQVVSGNVTGDGLLQLVDNATRQMRLMALAESANDTTAGVDEPAEHIVMETSENGSTIISDGTGRMPALDPKKVSAAASVGSRSVDVLVLTQDQEFLQTIKDSSRGMHKVYYANTLAQANDAIAKHKIGVAVVDAAMVGEKIEQLTQHLRKGSPRLVSVVAGRRDDGEMLMDLINRGKVYRFLLKPVSPGRARLAVESSVKHHLEAPDAAFKIKGSAAAAKPAKGKTPAAPKPVTKAPTAPPPATKPNAKAAPAKPKPLQPVTTSPATTAAPVDSPTGPVSAPGGESPIQDGLTDAFGPDDGSFSETVTGLISSVTRKFSSEAPPEAADHARPDIGKADLDAADFGGPGLGDPGLDGPGLDGPGLDGPGFGDPRSDSIDGGSGSEGSVFKNPAIMGVAAAAVVVIGVAIFWMMGNSDETTISPRGDSAAPLVTDSDAVIDEIPLESETTVGRSYLEDARLARDAGQIFNPDGDNAVELFAAAMDADPDNSTIASELEAVVGQALSMAETAMLESRLDDSAAALQRVAAVDPTNARLPFLAAQLKQMQLRASLDSARAAIRENRYEDAAFALTAARSLGLADTSEIDAVAAELNSARNEQQVDDVLAKASARLDAGNLLSPPNDNARYYYELALSNDAGNTAARQGLSVIAGKLAFQSRTEIDNGDLKLAENTLANARALDPANTEVAAATTALANARAAIAERQRRAEAERKAAAEREARAEAERLAAEQQAEQERLAAAELTAADPGGPVALNTNAADKPENGQASANPVQDRGPAAISSLNRTRYVAPKYPRSAQRRNLSGWVDVVFTVALDGTVSNIDIRNSEPGDTFVNAATKAVERWEFEPVIENGQAVEKRVGVRMMFALE